MLKTLRPSPKASKQTMEALADAFCGALVSVASSEVVRAQLQRDGFFLFPATPSGRALANRVREVVAAAKASDFELVASGSRWQGRTGCWTALAPVARVVQRLVALLLHVRDEALQSTEPLPFLAPPWAKGQQPHHDLDEQLRALSWLFSLTDVPEVNATGVLPRFARRVDLPLGAGRGSRPRRPAHRGAGGAHGRAACLPLDADAPRPVHGQGPPGARLRLRDLAQGWL